MAEYVNTIFVERILEAITDDKELIANTMNSLPIADVIERFKVDEAIEDMERYSVAADYEGEKEISKAIDKCVEILKRNIGE